jgi:hypothetical protein
MQIQNSITDPSLSSASLDNQIDVAVAVKARQVQIQQGEAAVELVKQAVDISQQIASGHVDVQL